MCNRPARRLASIARVVSFLAQAASSRPGAPPRMDDVGLFARSFPRITVEPDES